MAKTFQSDPTLASAHCVSPGATLACYILNYLKGGSFFNGQFKRIAGEPPGAPHQDWIKNVPNDGLIYYTSLLNAERLFPTSPEALGEVLTTKSYDFIKPAMLRHGIGTILGTGLVFAEGDEHKVR